MRRAQLKVEPIEGDDYPAELIVFAFRGGMVRSKTISRGGRSFKDEEAAIRPKSKAKRFRQKTLKARAFSETSGHYYPAGDGRSPTDLVPKEAARCSSAR